MPTSANPGITRNAKPFIYGPEVDAVAEVMLNDGEFGHSTVTEDFERAVAAYLGVPHVVAVATGTDALHIALRTAGIGPGDEVVVPSMTFVASIAAIRMVGAQPRFIECDPDTLCVTAAGVRDAIGPRTKAVMPVLYGGRAINLSEVAELLADRGIAVVEDAAQAFGSYQGDHRVGATGALTCFSFGPIKNLTCGQGGALIPRDDAEAHTARYLRLLGMVASQAERKRSGMYSIDHDGIRATMGGLNAAIGLVQLGRFGEMETRRKNLWRAYATHLADVAGADLVDVDVDRTVPFNCVVKLDNRDEVFAVMRDAGIGVGVHYPPNHLQPIFADWHRPLPVTEHAAGRIMSLPFHPAMTVEHVAAAVQALTTTMATVGGTR